MRRAAARVTRGGAALRQATTIARPRRLRSPLPPPPLLPQRSRDDPGLYRVATVPNALSALRIAAAPPASSDTRELVLWRPTPSAQPPRTQWTIPVAPVELPPPPPPAAVTPPSSRALTPVRAKRRFVDVDGDDARASKRPMRSSCVNRFFASAPGKRPRSRSPSPSPRKRRGAMMSP